MCWLGMEFTDDAKLLPSDWNFFFLCFFSIESMSMNSDWWTTHNTPIKRFLVSLITEWLNYSTAQEHCHFRQWHSKWVEKFLVVDETKQAISSAMSSFWFSVSAKLELEHPETEEGWLDEVIKFTLVAHFAGTGTKCFPVGFDQGPLFAKSCFTSWNWTQRYAVCNVQTNVRTSCDSLAAQAQQDATTTNSLFVYFFAHWVTHHQRKFPSFAQSKSSSVTYVREFFCGDICTKISAVKLLLQQKGEVHRK